MTSESGMVIIATTASVNDSCLSFISCVLKNISRCIVTQMYCFSLTPLSPPALLRECHTARYAHRRSDGATPLRGRWERGISVRRPARGRGGREGVLYIGHRFADDRCLWSEHPSGASRKSLTWYTITLILKCVPTIRYSKKVSQAPGRRRRSLEVRVASRP